MSNTLACPVFVGDVFTTAEHGDVVVALRVDQRKPDVWSVQVQPVTEDAHGVLVACDWEPTRWTSIKVSPSGRSQVEYVGRIGSRVGLGIVIA